MSEALIVGISCGLAYVLLELLFLVKRWRR